MKSHEPLIAPQSDYYIYSPSLIAQEMFLYPLYCGHFIYEKSYSLHRESYNSYLLLYIEKGQLILTYENKTYDISAGSFLLIDCYKPHSYSTLDGCETLWCHFDGKVAANMYETITSHNGNVFTLNDSYYVINKLQKIYQTFVDGNVIKEPLMSKYLNDILTSLLLYTPKDSTSYSYINMAEETISYIHEHLTEDISVPTLAERVGLNLYHFIRSFRKETGFTPHDYIIHTRINTAKYLLKNTELPIKEIYYHCGFSSESVFCNCFKQRLKLTPIQYRKQETQSSL